MGTEEAISSTNEGTTVSNLEQKIIQQVEYYFGDYNLARDKFLKEQVSLDDGWVPFTTLITFNRLKKLSDDCSVICNALKKSLTQLLEISEDGEKIRRRLEKPVPEISDVLRADTDNRTVYVKGFKKETTLDELLEFFKSYDVENVFMRRHMRQPKKTFKGSVFVTFKTNEAAEAFLNLNAVKYEEGGNELMRDSKLKYKERKNKFFEQQRKEKEEKKQKKVDAIEAKAEAIKFKPGCLLKLEGLGIDCTREVIREALQSYSDVLYVDYNKGKPSAVVTFGPEKALEVLNKITEKEGEKQMEIGSEKVSISVIEGEDETKYWKLVAVNKAVAKTRKKASGSNKKKGRFGSNKRKGKKDDDEEVEPASKRIKVEMPDAEMAVKNGKKHCSEDEDVEPVKKHVKAEEPGDVEMADGNANGSQVGNEKAEKQDKVATEFANSEQ